MAEGPVEFGVKTLLGERAAMLQAATPLEEPIVVHGDPKRFGTFTDIPQLRSATAVMDTWDGTLNMARAWSPPGRTPFELRPTREQLRTLYDAGFTIVLEGIESFIPQLRPLCRALERDLGVAPGRVNVEVFCAREGGTGRPHFDPSFAFNCQIEGVKTWRLARSEAVRFPPTGMFLGRDPEPEMDACMRGRLPDKIEGGELVVAKPGTVVFLPPGVLHETRMETASFAVAFAIEQTDTVAKHVASLVRTILQDVPELRAARLGAQKRAICGEVSLVAERLRHLADTIERTGSPWCSESDRFRLRTGLSVDLQSDTSITLRSTGTRRTLALNEVLVAILFWASGRGEFDLRDLTFELSTIDPVIADRYIQKLIRAGLMERMP